MPKVTRLVRGRAGVFPLPECVYTCTQSSVVLCPLPDCPGWAPAVMAFALWTQGGKSGLGNCSSAQGPGSWGRQAGRAVLLCLCQESLEVT